MSDLGDDLSHDLLTPHKTIGGIIISWSKEQGINMRMLWRGVTNLDEQRSSYYRSLQPFMAHPVKPIQVTMMNLYLELCVLYCNPLDGCWR